jgi:hypothetical protein
MSSLYPKGAGHILTGDIDFATDTIKVLFYAGAYNAGHEFVADLTGASIIARSGALAGKTEALGVFDANDLTILAVSGAPFTHLILYKDTGSDATSLLAAEFTVASFTPSGGDVNVVFNAAGLFSIE